MNFRVFAMMDPIRVDKNRTFLGLGSSLGKRRVDPGESARVAPMKVQGRRIGSPQRVDP
jgi:hypothetical protein